MGPISVIVQQFNIVRGVIFRVIIGSGSVVESVARIGFAIYSENQSLMKGFNVIRAIGTILLTFGISRGHSRFI